MAAKKKAALNDQKELIMALDALEEEKQISKDIILEEYNPETTAFMCRCAEQGAKVLNGLDMLHRQAEAAWTIWRGTGA